MRFVLGRLFIASCVRECVCERERERDRDRDRQTERERERERVRACCICVLCLLACILCGPDAPEKLQVVTSKVSMRCIYEKFIGQRSWVHFEYNCMLSLHSNVLDISHGAEAASGFAR